MNIAELFVTLGVKDPGKAKKAISEVKQELVGAKDSAIAAKVGIVGFIYGLERMMSTSAARGMQLQQFANATGLSIEMLQKWQYAAQDFGVSNEEVAGSIKSVQQAMIDMQMGKGQIEGFGALADTVGFDMNKARDTFYVMNKLQEFAKRVPPDVASSLLRSFGISENMFQFLRMNKREIEKVKPSNILSSKEVAALAQVDVAWTRLWNNLKIQMGGFVAMWGGQAVGALSNSIKFISQLYQNLVKLTNQFPLLKKAIVLVGSALALYFAPLTATIAGAVLLMNELQKHKDGKDSLFGRGKAEDEINDRMKSLKNQHEKSQAFRDKISSSSEFGTFLMNMIPNKTWQQVEPDLRKQVQESMKKPDYKFDTKVPMNQNLYFYGDPDKKEVQDGAKKGMESAFNKFYSQTQVT